MIYLKKAPTKVFVIEADKYVEITYLELKERRETEKIEQPSSSEAAHTPYKDRFFIPLHGMLLEVSEEVYAEYYKKYEHNRYLKKLDIIHGLISMDNMDNSETVVLVEAEDMADSVERETLKQKLNDCLSKLTEDERDLMKSTRVTRSSKKHMLWIASLTNPKGTMTDHSIMLKTITRQLCQEKFLTRCRRKWHDGQASAESRK